MFNQKENCNKLLLYNTNNNFYVIADVTERLDRNVKIGIPMKITNLRSKFPFHLICSTGYSMRINLILASIFVAFSC